MRVVGTQTSVGITWVRFFLKASRYRYLCLSLYVTKAAVFSINSCGYHVCVVFV